MDISSIASGILGNAQSTVSGVTEIVQVGFDAIIFLIVLAIGAAVAVAMLPPTNPLHALCFSLAKKAAVTAGLGILTPPIEMLPGADIIYDFATPIGLLMMWMQFGHQIRKSGLMASLIPSKNTGKQNNFARSPSPRHQPYQVVEAEEVEESTGFNDLSRRQ